MIAAAARDALLNAGYALLDLATAGRGILRAVCGEPVRFPARWFRYYPAIYEPATFTFLRQHVERGSTVLDIGAHIGLFTVLLARLVGPAGRVVSFEPTESTREVLHRTVLLNGVGDRVVVRCEAVAQDRGTRFLYQRDVLGSNANSLVPDPGTPLRAQIPVISVDDVTSEIAGRVSCLKIDVEGSEVEVLRGARQTIARWRPAVALGVHPVAMGQAGESLETLWSEFERGGMTVSYEGKPVAREWFVSRRQLFDVQALPEGTRV